jgi:hypothetical protein
MYNLSVAVRLLDSHTIQGAEHDSSARYPPPRCHPGTRKTLRGEILHWVADPMRGWRMFYVLGPAGVGKSAVAQTVADEVDCLGASCIISRPNGRNDPDRVIPTLAYQLAVKNPAYKDIISDKIAHDPAILRKTRRIQFKELLIDPFRTIMAQDISTVQKPLLIIIDGLDECKDERAQCEFIELIGGHVRSSPEFPLLWLICSRPESHLKYTLSQVDFQVTCRREEISIDDKEGRQDVLQYLRGKFRDIRDIRDIRSRYHDSLDHDWPLESHLLRIATAASGHFAFASTVVRFVGDADTGDPSSQLLVCVKAIGGSRTLVCRNPYVSLDLLYRHILSSVNSAIRPTTMRILGLFIFNSYHLVSRSAQALANFFLIKKAAFYHVLKPLHSVLHVPSPSDAFTKSIEFYHASFAEFLGDPARSGEFCLDEAAVHYDIAASILFDAVTLWGSIYRRHDTI